MGIDLIPIGNCGRLPDKWLKKIGAQTGTRAKSIGLLPLLRTMAEVVQPYNLLLWPVQW